LAFDLVKLNPQKVVLPRAWEKNCQFPLLLKIPKRGNPAVTCKIPLPYNHFKDSLPGITQNAFAFIESMQPYYRGDGPTQLGWLSELSNIDKHRHLNIINPQAYQREHVRSPRIDSEAIFRLPDGAELKAALHSAEDLADVFYRDSGIDHAFVSFDESVLSEEVNDIPVDNVLELCTRTLTTVVIPAFEEFINNP
jgi:hypothetical protein